MTAIKSQTTATVNFFVIFYFSSDTEIHDTETRIETKKYTIDSHIYRFNIKHAWLFFS